MGESPYVAVARVARTHGLSGELGFAPLFADGLDWLVDTEVWFVPPVHAAVPFTPTAVRPGPKGPLVTVGGIEGVDVARDFVGATVLVHQDAVPDAYLEALDDDPVGLRVIDEERGELGTIVETLVTGANDVWVVEGAHGEVLLPVIDDVVLSVDRDENAVRVRLLPGLLDEE